MSKAIVLFSGGQDSTTCLFWAKSNFDQVVAASVFYGQRHAAELDAGADICRQAGVRRVVLEMPALGQLADSALVDRGQPLTADGGAVDREAPNGLPSSFVPGRNALMLALVAALAVKEGAKDIVTGVCQTDFSGYPDCRREFVDAMERALTLAMPSSAGPLRILTPLMHLTKAETVRLAARLPGAWDALALSITCYEGERPGCGRCPACELRAKGFTEAGIPDPARTAPNPFAIGK
jgi:7-cyano-7-deazaguanine synthase